MKSNDTYKPIREGLKPVLKSLTLARVKSSPPSYARPGGFGHICLWFKVRSAGWDYALGGEFTGALQSATKTHPGIEGIVGDSDFASKRIWSLLNDTNRRAAIDLHNSIIKKFSEPPPDHWIYTMRQEIIDSTLADLEPLTEIASNDFWFRYLDSGDVAQWTTFIADTLPQIVDDFESSLIKMTAVPPVHKV